MAGVLPTKLLKFDDGSGTYPTDMTSRLDLNSISVQPYGRADEQTTASTTELTITLNNNDGALTSGASLVTVGQGVRLTYTVGSTTVDQFTGRVASAVLSWEGGPAKKANLVVTAYDVTAELGRRQMRSMLEEEILLRSPSTYYPLTEVQDSTSAGDISGNGTAPLVSAHFGAGLAFGGATAPDDGLPAVQFNGGRYLSNGTSGTTGASPSAASFGCWFQITTPPSGSDVYVLLGSGLYVDSTGSLFFDLVSTSTDVADGAWHFAFLVIVSGFSETLYLDGLPVDSVTAGGTGHWNAPIVPLATVGGGNFAVAFPSGTGTSTTGAIASVAAFDYALTDADVLAIYQAGTGASEATDARLTRLASYVGLTAATASPSGQLMSAQVTSGSSALDALEAVAAAEGGLLYVDGSGSLRMQGRYYRAQQTTAALALTGRDLDPASTAITLDIQQVVNQVTATRTGGAQQVAVNQTSVDTAGAFPQSVELAVAADSDALGYAQWTVAKHANPAPRMASVTFNMFTSPNREAILGAEVGDRVSLSSMPSQLFSGFGDVTLEGWADSLSVSGGTVTWTRTANLLPWSLFEAFILNSSTYGVLNGAVPIGY